MVRGKNLCKISTDAWIPVLKPPQIKPLQPIFASSFCKRKGDVINSGVVEKSYCIVETVSDKSHSNLKKNFLILETNLC